MRIYVDDTPDSVVLLDGYDVDYDVLLEDDEEDLYRGFCIEDYDNVCD